MSVKTIEWLIWVLIYGGALTGVLGLAVQRTSEAFGWSLVVGGALAAAAGAALIVVRSRMKGDA